MLLEIVGFVGAFIVLLYYFAEQKKPLLGLAGSVVMMVLGFWILSDGLQIRTGEQVTEATASLENGSIVGASAGTAELDGNTTTYSEDLTSGTNLTLSGTRSQNVTYVYAPIPAAPYTGTSPFIGLMLVILSIYGLLYYVAVMIKG